MKKKSFFDSRAFGVIAIIYGITGLLILSHHIFSYEAILRPNMSYLIENKVITNNISGGTFLYFFTNQSNLFVDLYLILLGVGLFGSKRLYALTHREGLRGAVTLYILFTGLIYCCVLLPTSTGGYPWEKGIWFSNIVNYWSHMLTPVLFTLFWFVPLGKRPVKIAKTSLLYLTYPVAYFLFSAIRGRISGFYPYPFLDGEQMFSLLFKGMEYSPLAGAVILAAVFIAFSGIFFGLGCVLNKVRGSGAMLRSC